MEKNDLEGFIAAQERSEGYDKVVLQGDGITVPPSGRTSPRSLEKSEVRHEDSFQKQIGSVNSLRPIEAFHAFRNPKPLGGDV